MQDVADDGPVVPSMESQSLPPPKRLKQQADAFIAAARQRSDIIQNMGDDGAVIASIESKTILTAEIRSTY